MTWASRRSLLESGNGFFGKTEQPSHSSHGITRTAAFAMVVQEVKRMAGSAEKMGAVRPSSALNQAALILNRCAERTRVAVQQAPGNVSVSQVNNSQTTSSEESDNIPSSNRLS